VWCIAPSRYLWGCVHIKGAKENHEYKDHKNLSDHNLHHLHCVLVGDAHSDESWLYKRRLGGLWHFILQDSLAGMPAPSLGPVPMPYRIVQHKLWTRTQVLKALNPWGRGASSRDTPIGPGLYGCHSSSSKLKILWFLANLPFSTISAIQSHTENPTFALSAFSEVGPRL